MSAFCWTIFLPTVLSVSKHLQHNMKNSQGISLFETLKGKTSSGKLLKQIVQSILIFFRQMKVAKLDGYSFV